MIGPAKYIGEHTIGPIFMGTEGGRTNRYCTDRTAHERQTSSRPAEHSCMSDACMPNVQIRDVPDEVHNELVRRAELAGQSLQQSLSAQLASMVATPTIDDVIARIEHRSKGQLSRADAVTAITDERARR